MAEAIAIVAIVITVKDGLKLASEAYDKAKGIAGTFSRSTKKKSIARVKELCTIVTLYHERAQDINEHIKSTSCKLSATVQKIFSEINSRDQAIFKSMNAKLTKWNKEKGGFFTNLYQKKDQELTEMAAELKERTGQLMQIKLDLTGAAVFQMSAFCKDLKDLTAQDWWIQKFGLHSEVSMANFLSAYEGYLRETHSFDNDYKFNDKFFESLAKIIDTPKAGKVNNMVDVRKFNYFLECFGPMEVSLDKVLPLLAASGELQGWFFLKSELAKQEENIKKFGTTVWIHAPGLFCVRSRPKNKEEDPVKNLTVRNDPNNEIGFANADNHGYCGYWSSDNRYGLTVPHALKDSIGFLLEMGNESLLKGSDVQIDNAAENPGAREKLFEDAPKNDKDESKLFKK